MLLMDLILKAKNKQEILLILKKYQKPASEIKYC